MNRFSLFAFTLGSLVMHAAVPALAGAQDRDKDSPRPLAELAKNLKNPDRWVRLRAAKAIRDDFKGKSLEVLPLVIEAFGKELEQPVDVVRPAPDLEQTLWQAAAGAGPERVKVLRESTTHRDQKVRAAAFALWVRAAYDKAAGVDRNELLVAALRGIKDDSPLVRGRAVSALAVFTDKTDQIIPLLTTALADRTVPAKGVDSVAFYATCGLREFRPKARSAIPALAGSGPMSGIVRESPG